MPWLPVACLVSQASANRWDQPPLCAVISSRARLETLPSSCLAAWHALLQERLCLSMPVITSWVRRFVLLMHKTATRLSRVAVLCINRGLYIYCSTRRCVGGGGAGSPQMLQERAVERFICPHCHGPSVPERTLGGATSLGSG